MSQKLDRLAEELEKAKKKQEEINLKVEDLQRRYTETENTEIQNIVRSASISVDDLKALLETRSREINPVMAQTLSDYGDEKNRNPDAITENGNPETDSRSYKSSWENNNAGVNGNAGTFPDEYTNTNESEGDGETDEADEN